MKRDKNKHPQKPGKAAGAGYINPWYHGGPTAAQMQTHICKLQRELFCLWSYIGQEGLWSEAKEYLDENADIPTLFESPQRNISFLERPGCGAEPRINYWF
ncbi:MAG: hypothetical protein LIO91_06695 [Bacteroidales bacterium]|nr:hypothetical protein [Bacteroidales bacterium]